MLAGPMTSGPAESAPADVALLVRVARRDADALAALYDRHRRLLFSLILRILRDRGEAEDVLQEVFVRVWDRAESYSPALGTPSSWLVRVARNRAIDRLRSRHVRAKLSDPIASAPPAVDETMTADPEARASHEQRRSAVRAALEELPHEQRILVDAAYFEGFTQSELAEKFGVPLGTVKTRIRAAMQALRTRLAGE
jgi:RNA polymerase sigma-70 factor (ECF subfamily)